MAYWQTTMGNTQYTITIIDRFVRLAKSSGGPDTYGGNDVPAQRFLRSARLKSHVSEVFGEKVLREVIGSAEIAAELPITPRKS